MLSIVTGINPNDPIETMIGVKMAAIFSSAMKAASLLSRSPILLEQEIAEARLNKLTRTFAMLVIALDGHRRRSEPPVSVNNVSVSNGAVVGNVTQNSARPTPKSAVAPAAIKPMQITGDPVREVVPAKRKAKP
jgi:hypothetical protein